MCMYHHRFTPGETVLIRATLKPGFEDISENLDRCTDDGWETVGRKNKSSTKIDGQNHNSAFLGEYRPMAASQASRPTAAPTPAAQPAAPAQPAAAPAAPASEPAPRSASHAATPSSTLAGHRPAVPVSHCRQSCGHVSTGQVSPKVLRSCASLDVPCSSLTCK